jgi:hypothetical protein
MFKWVDVHCLLFNASCNVTLIMWNHVWGVGFSLQGWITYAI